MQNFGPEKEAVGRLRFLRDRMRDFRDPFQERPSSFFILLRRSSKPVASLNSRSVWSDWVGRTLVSCSCMCWSWVNLCLTTINVSGFRARYAYASPSPWSRLKADLSDAHLVALTGNFVNTTSLRSQVVLHRVRGAGDLPGRHCTDWL